MPSFAERPAFFAASARPFSRRILRAASMSPPASVRAFLQSIMPAPVESLSALTSLALISAICVPILPHACSSDLVLRLGADRFLAVGRLRSILALARLLLSGAFLSFELELPLRLGLLGRARQNLCLCLRGGLGFLSGLRSLPSHRPALDRCVGDDP